MAKYRVLQSAGHNWGASFISVMNIASDDFAMCHLVRAVQATGLHELRVDLLTGQAGPTELLSPALQRSIAGYCEGFGAHIQRSGAALDMVSAAEMRIRIRLAPVEGRHETLFADQINALLDCVVSIADDRGQRHDASTQGTFVCHRVKRFY